MAVAELNYSQIRWFRYERLVMQMPKDELSVEFVREALSYGVEVSYAFELSEDAGHWERRAFRLVIDKDDRQHGWLRTWSQEIRIKIPEEHRRWVRPLLGRRSFLGANSSKRQN